MNKYQILWGSLLSLAATLGGHQISAVATQLNFNAPDQGQTSVLAQTNPGVTAITGVTPTNHLVADQAPITRPAVVSVGTQIELSTGGEPQVVADGRSLLTITGRVLDRQGQPVTTPLTITLTTSGGRFVGNDASSDQVGFQVNTENGTFTAQLQAGLETGRFRIRAATTVKDPAAIALNGRPVEREIEAFIQVEFITNLRPSLTTGVVNLQVGPRGLNYWGSRSDFLRPDLLTDDRYEVSAGGAAFATGRIGEWLFTGAYNSRRNLNETCDRNSRLYRDVQFCEQQYPVYGDNSRVDFLTPSRDSLFLRFERNSPTLGAEVDFLQWGDYGTTELARSSQLFTATNRQLHGFKGNFSLGNLQITALYSYNIQGFQRDAITPDGTSGFYFLSRRLVIAGSENVYLEAEELNRPGTVVERRLLRRSQDYEIDYDRGTLLFRRPILALDFDPFGNTLVRRIVTTYQFDANGSTDTNLYAGRLQYNFQQGLGQSPAFAGTTYLRENLGARQFELYGADLRIPLGNGQIIAEMARSRNRTIEIGDVFGNAYRIEAQTSLAQGVAARAYYRTVTENFANNATTSFTPGQTRYGANLTARISPSTNFNLGFDYEANFGIAQVVRTQIFDLFSPPTQAPAGTRLDNTLTTFQAGIQQTLGSAQLNVDLVNRNRTDNTNLLSSGNSTQIVSNFNLPLTENLNFRARNELNLGSRTDSLYPNRSTLGLDWRALPGVNFRLAHQFRDGRLFGQDSFTSLDTLLEHRLTENTALTGRYSVFSGVNGVIGQGAIGLNHAWVVSPGLRINLSYEYIFNNLFANTAAGPQFAQPFASGQTAASLGSFGGQSYSIGVEYNPNREFQASARLERRVSGAGNNTVITAAAAGRISPSITGLLRFQQAGSSTQLFQFGNSADLRLGLAWRDPADDRFNALLSYRYRANPNVTPDTLLISSGTGSLDHIFAAEAIYAPDWQWEFYGKYAFRSSTSFLANTSTATSSIWLGQLRATYRFAYQFDLAGEIRWIGQPGMGYNELGLALEGGYYLSPDLRAYIGYSFGQVDDRDFNGFRSRGGIYFGLTFKINELWDGFGRQRPQPRTETAETPPSTTLARPLR